MTSLEEQSQQKQSNWNVLTTEQKSHMLCLLVGADQGARNRLAFTQKFAVSSMYKPIWLRI